MKYLTPDDFSITLRSLAEVHSMRLSDHYSDETIPFIGHCFDVKANEWADFSDLDEEDEKPVLADLEPGTVVARLIVNEFPLHMARAARVSWYWLFDMCSEGTPEFLGNMLDHLQHEAILDLDKNSGTLLHLQSVEVLPPLRRMGIGTDLVLYALALLSRSNMDVAIAADHDNTSNNRFETLLDMGDRRTAAGSGDVAGSIVPRTLHSAIADEVGMAGPALVPSEERRIAAAFWKSLGFHAWTADADTMQRLEPDLDYGLQLVPADVPSGAFWREIKSSFRRSIATAE